MTEIPVLVPPASAPVSQAWLTTAAFRGYPHWLDLDDLIQGGTAGIEDDALADVLLAATDWCVGQLEDMPLNGHLVTGESGRTRVKGGGRVHIRPQHVPARAVVSLRWGADPSAMQDVLLPDGSMWFEGDGRRVSWRPGGAIGAFRGPALQFGPPVAPSREVFYDWSYAAGYPVSVLSADAESGAQSVTLADATSVLPGDVLRCYDPGSSEALTVASSYVPTVPATPVVPLAAPLQHDHAAGAGVTGMPRRAVQAVIAYAVALLMRVDVSEEPPASDFGPDARESSSEGDRGGAAGGLVNNARGWLAPFRPTWRP